MLKIRNLQINHLSNPVGIDVAPLRLTWTLAGETRQTAFSVSVMDKAGNVQQCSGKVLSNQMFCNLQPLQYRSDYAVNVQVWDEHDVASCEETIFVTTGISSADWVAKWINPELKRGNAKRRKPASYLKKIFFLDSVSNAKLYITCHGIFNVYINGREATQMQLMPGTSQYNKRLVVQTLDVAEYLQPGENTIVITLGDGWYRGSMGYMQSKNVFGSDIALLAQLEMDGKPCIVTDESWLASNDGPLGYNDLMAGEEYDARREQSMTYHGVKVEKFGYDNLVCTDTVPILPKEHFAAKLIRTPNGEQLLDFGENIVGYVSFELNAKAGQKLTLILGETLDAAGNFTIANFQAPSCPTEQKIEYTCKDGKNTYHPTKTYMGFRYAKVDADFSIDPQCFTGVAVYSDMRVTGTFECGVPEVNQLVKNTLRSMKGNFVDVPTDCPTREKSGYSGDAQVFAHTAAYLMDCYPVYAKWIREQAATQFPNGCVAQVAPNFTNRQLPPDGGIGWCDSFQIIPEKLWQRYNDPSLVEEHYEQIKAWIEYRIKKSKKPRFHNRKLIPKQFWPYTMDNGWLWGEWLEPGVADDRIGMLLKGDLEISCAFAATCCDTLCAMASHLHKDTDVARYREYSKKAREAYRYLFVKNGYVEKSERQCRYVRPIAHNMLTEEEKLESAATLAELIRRCENKIGTGFLSTHELCRVLTHYGQQEIAYDLLLQRNAPGWLCSVLKGATTIPENWDAFGEDGEPHGSFNHYSYGSVVGWLFDSVCGIRLHKGTVVIQPFPDARLGYAKAEYDSPLGYICSQWSFENDKIIYTVEIPANTEATVILGDDRYHVDSGVHCFEKML